MNNSFPSKRAPVFADVPTEKWNDWRWQLSHRLNTVEEIEKIIPLTDSEKTALNAAASLPGGGDALFHLVDRPERSG